ncbi:MAG: PepSY-like domain-containing protein [Bacteroidales bacterium]
MKKIGLIFMALLLFNFTFAENNQEKKIRNAKFSDLPALSQKFITQYLPKLTIEYITVDGTRKAEVDFTDGTELEFGREGFWREIDNDRGLSINHLQMLPGQMLTSLQKDFGEYTIETVEQKDLYYKVELKAKNGKEIEIRYDLNGQYLF